VAELNGNLFVLESGGSTLGYADEVLQHLAKVAKKWNVNYVVAEANMGDGMFTALLKPHMLREHPCTIEEVKHSIRKETRLCDTLAPLIQQHRLVVTSRVIRQDYRMLDEDPEHGYSRSLFWQMSRLTEEKGCLSFDDRIDALAIAVAFFVEAAAQDQMRQQLSRADALREEAVASWLQGTEADIDCLALGWRAPKTSGPVHGGVKRLSVGA
jgi:phage terminase large subunit-like protein